MPIPAEITLVQHADHKQALEERLELALLLLKDLNPLKEKADEEGFEFLSYLLSMAILEAQSVASGHGESLMAPCELCGRSYEANSLGGSGEESYKQIC